jgi:hypothetical protein
MRGMRPARETSGADGMMEYRLSRVSGRKLDSSVSGYGPQVC